MIIYFFDSLKNTCIKYWTAQWSSGIPTTSIKISDTGTTIFWLLYLKLVENNRFSKRSDWKKISHRLYMKPFLENPVKLSHFSFSTKGIETFCKILARIFWWAENPKLYLIDLKNKVLIKNQLFPSQQLNSKTLLEKLRILRFRASKSEQ